MDKREFILKEEHVTLLQRAYIGWQDCETGAPEINPKRPYGNSDVPSDVAEILGEEIKKDADDYGMDEDQRARLMELHRETQHALQIILSTKSFRPGKYVNRSKWGTDWQLEE